MNTHSIKHNIEIIANVGVLLGIILLAYEVNQGNQLLELQSEYTQYQGGVSDGNIESIPVDGWIWGWHYWPSISAAWPLYSATIGRADFIEWMEENVVSQLRE